MEPLKQIGRSAMAALLCLIATSQARASDVPASVVYQGRLFKSNGVDALEDASVTFKIQIRSPDGLCLLFEETHWKDMSGTSGVFSLNIGEGTNTNASPLNIKRVFDNSAQVTGAAGCVYLPSAGDTRKLRLSYDTGVEVVTIPADQTVRSVPYALQAGSLQGLTKDKFLQISTNITQARAEGLFTSYNELSALAAGTSTLYAKAGDFPTGMTNGQSLAWDAAHSRWQATTPTYGTVTSITAGAGLNGGVISSSGTISMPNVGTAGSYAKVTTDAQGRVVSGTGLSAADMPSAAGDVGGAFASLTVSKIQGITVSSTAPVAGQILTYNAASSRWEAQTAAAAPVQSLTGTAPLSVSAGANPVVSLQSGTSAGQNLRWNGGAWVSGFPNLSDLRGAALATQIPTNCSSGQVWAYQAMTDTFACTNIAIGTSQISGLGGAATLNVGTAAGTVAAGNDARLTSALLSTAAAGGDLSGTNGSPTVSKIQGIPVVSGSPAANQVLKYNAAALRWEFTADDNSGGTVTGITAGTGLTGSTINTSGTIAVDVGTTANKIVQLDNSGRLPAVDASQLTNLPGQSPFSRVLVFDSSTTWTVPAGVTRAYVQVWGSGGGGAGGSLNTVAGSGGGAGGYGADFVTVTPGAGIAIVVGAAGTAGTVGNGGGNGNPSSFNGTLSANGGSGGGAAAGIGALGGVSTATINIAGGTGDAGTALSVTAKGGHGGAAGGAGGAGGSGSASATLAGLPGARPGGGGGGGGNTIVLGSSGGAGGAGRVMVWY